MLTPPFINKYLAMSMIALFGLTVLVSSCGNNQSDLYVNRFNENDVESEVSDFDVTLNELRPFPPGTELKILQWKHFVPQYDIWFDEFAVEWGEQNGVDVTVDHFQFDEFENPLEEQLANNGSYTLIEGLFPPSAWIEDLHDLTDLNQEAIALLGDQKETCRASSYLPTIDSYYAFCHGYAPSPGNYLIEEWASAGYPNGPEEWQHLIDGGQQIADLTGKPVGLGISPEIDSEVVIRAIIWSFGGAIQDQNENVVLNTPETVEAIKYIDSLFHNSMSDSVLNWKPSSNNEGLINGNLSFIQNSLSAYRTLQKADAPRSENVGFSQPLSGPAGALAPAHVWMIYVVPKYVEPTELQAAKAFMLHLAANYGQAVFNSELYNFPAWPDVSPQLIDKDGWLNQDPFGEQVTDKLSVLDDSEGKYVNFGYPGVANPAISQIYDEKVISNMVARVVTGEMTAEESVEIADQRAREIFEIWREKGLVGGTE